MSSKAQGVLYPVLLGILIMSSTGISKDTSKQWSTELKSKVFWLKTHENVFGRPGPSKWSWERTVFSADISVADNEVSIHGSKSWKSQYFVSRKQFVVSDVKVSGNTVEVRMKDPNASNGSQLKLKFIGLDRFKSGFDAIFFRPGDDMDGYENAVNRLLIATYLDPQFSSTETREDEKLQLLQDLKPLSVSGKPEIVRQKEGAYALVSLGKEDGSYNVLQVNKNQRISSTLDKTLRRAKSRIATRPRSPYLRGYSFSWQVFYHDPLGSLLRDQVDTIELITAVSVFGAYKDGELSVLETVQKSILKVNGEKYTLTDYQPIGTEVPN